MCSDKSTHGGNVNVLTSFLTLNNASPHINKVKEVCLKQLQPKVYELDATNFFAEPFHFHRIGGGSSDSSLCSGTLKTIQTQMLFVTSPQSLQKATIRMSLYIPAFISPLTTTSLPVPAGKKISTA